SPPDSFANAEPFRMCGKRHVMDCHNRRHTTKQRRAVARREKHIEMIACRDRRHLDLFPPAAARSGNEARREAATVDREIQRGWCVENEFVHPCTIVASPLVNQAAQIAADTGRAAAELARV